MDMGEIALLDIIAAAGWPIWLLIATSVLGLALVIERFLSLRTGLILPSRLPEQVLELLRQKNDSPDAIVRLSGNSPLGRVLAEVLLNRHESPSYRMAAVEDTGKDVAHHLNRYIPALATIAVV